MDKLFINGKEFRYARVRGRGKWIAKDGDAYNPYHFNQTATTHINPDGCPCFGGGIPVHLYVAKAWVDGEGEDTEVDHIDFDRTNYDASNLRWVNHRDNILHSSSNGRYTNKDGENNGRATLTQSQVDEIRRLFSLGMSTTDVIKHLHPDYDFKERKRIWNKINRIKRGETWNK